MGYQESFRPIKHLAEAAGIERAIEDYDDYPNLPEYCVYYCASRERGTGSLYVCIGGQRCRVHILAGMDLDYCIPHEANYSDYYEDIDEALVEEAAKERPDLVEKAYQEVANDYERAARRERQRDRERREEALAIWPDIARFLQVHGPSSIAKMSIDPQFDKHYLDNVLVELSCLGLVDSVGRYFRDEIVLTPKAREELGIREGPVPVSVEERLDLALREFGPVSSSKLSSYLGLNINQTRKLLNQQIKSGRVIPEGRG